MADVIVPTNRDVAELVAENPLVMKKEAPEPLEVHPNVVIEQPQVVIKSLEEEEPEKLYTKKGVTKTESEVAKKLEKKYKILGPQTIQVKDIEAILLGPIQTLLNDPDDLGRFKLAQRTVCKTDDVEPTSPDNYITALTMKGLAQAKDNKKVCVKEHFFENVNETIKSAPAVVSTPKSVEELQQVIKSAADKKQKLRVVGAGHSWTPVFPEDGAVLVSLHYLKGVTHDTSGPEDTWTVTFQAGERTKDLHRYFHPHNITFPTNVVMDHVGYGGLVSMGCHGTGWNIQTISDLCVGLKLVDAHGEIREFSRKKDGERIWGAMLVNLGVMGVVFEYTLRVWKDFNVVAHDWKMPSRDLFGEGAESAFRDLVVSRHSSQFFWMPFNDHIWCKTFEETDQKVTVPETKYVIDTFTNWIAMNFGVPLDNLTTKATELTPLFLKAGFASFPDDYKRVETISHAIHWEKSLDAIKIMCMEFAFPIRAGDLSDWAKIGQCVRYVQKRIHELGKKKLYPLNLALEMRFISGSDGILSIAHGNEHTCFIEIVTSIDAPMWKEFSSEVALEWMRIFPAARPHWAKMCQQIPGIEKVIRDAYGENIQKFVEIRKELKVDPNDMFYTQWIGNILEPNRYQPYINVNPKKTLSENPDDIKKIGSEDKASEKKKESTCKCIIS